MLYVLNNVTTKNMTIYSKVYITRYNPKAANWCATMSDGSQIVWNRKYQEFYWIDEVGIDRCSYINCMAMFPELRDTDTDTWLIDNWHNWRFVETQKQLVAICNGKYDQHFINYWR